MCGLCAALSSVMMVLGGAFGILTYVCPMLAGLPVYLVRRFWGSRPALCLWVSAGLLSLMLVPDREMSLLYLGLLGWYPAAKPAFDRLPRPMRLPVKALCFGGVLLALYSLLLSILGGEALGLGSAWENLLFWLIGVITLLLYDLLLSRYAPVLERALSHIRVNHHL